MTVAIFLPMQEFLHDENGNVSSAIEVLQFMHRSAPKEIDAEG